MSIYEVEVTLNEVWEVEADNENEAMQLAIEMVPYNLDYIEACANEKEE